MSEPIIVVDSSEIREGRLEEVRAALKELAEFVETNEPDPIAYNVYFDEDGTRMTVVQVHPSSASMELHMKLAGPIFRKFAGLLRLSRVDFYGRPSVALLEQMREKARLLGNAAVVVNELQAGFLRVAARPEDVTAVTAGPPSHRQVDSGGDPSARAAAGARERGPGR